jgi:uncharacterized protein YecT (DUF1311 family)
MRRFTSSRALIAALVIGATAAEVHAQPAPSPPDCMANSAPTAVISCLAAQYADLDRQGNAAYKNALATVDRAGLNVDLSKDWKRALQEAQRKWLAYREADCGPPISYEAKGAATVPQLSCKIARTRERLDALKARYPA